MGTKIVEANPPPPPHHFSTIHQYSNVDYKIPKYIIQLWVNKILVVVVVVVVVNVRRKYGALHQSITSEGEAPLA